MNIEKQVGQLAELLLERLPGTIPSNTKVNPRDHVLVNTTQVDEKIEPLVLIHTTHTSHNQRPEEEVEKVDASASIPCRGNHTTTSQPLQQSPKPQVLKPYQPPLL